MALLGVVIVQVANLLYRTFFQKISNFQLDKTNSHKEAVGNFWIGVSAVVGMCWTSAFAGKCALMR